MLQFEDVEKTLTKYRQESAKATRNLFKLSRRLKAVALAAQVAIAVAIGAYGGEHGVWLGLLSLIPGLVFAGERMFALEKASGWHYEKRVAIDRLLTQLKTGAEPATVLNSFWELDGEMAKTFPHGSWS